jgi:hypothetical protein
MNKNTGDGELEELIAKYDDWHECDEYHIHDGTDEHEGRTPLPHDFDDDKLKTAIKKYAAQEANKAKQQLLQELMEKFQNWKLDTPQQLLGVDVDLPEAEAYTRGSNTVIKEIVSVIQNKLKGLS